MIITVILGVTVLSGFFKKGQIEKIAKIKKLTKFGRPWTG